MKNLMTIGLMTATLTLPHAAEASTSASAYELDGAHTDVSFKVRHLGVSSTRGSFRALSGTLNFNAKNLQESKVQIEIDVRSIDTANQRRDDHLRSSDFFDVEKYPTMSFVSSRVLKTKEGLRIEGVLTLHGIERPVSLEVEDMSPAVVGPYGFERRGFTATAKLDRRDFGLTWSKTLETGGLVVGHEVSITIEAEFFRKALGSEA